MPDGAYLNLIPALQHQLSLPQGKQIVWLGLQLTHILQHRRITRHMLLRRWCIIIMQEPHLKSELLIFICVCPHLYTVRYPHDEWRGIRQGCGDASGERSDAIQEGSCDRLESHVSLSPHFWGHNSVVKITFLCKNRRQKLYFFESSSSIERNKKLYSRF